MPAKKSTASKAAAKTKQSKPVKRARVKKSAPITKSDLTTESAAAPAEPTPAPTPAPAPAPVTQETTSSPSVDASSASPAATLQEQIELDFTNLNTKMNELRSLYVSITADMKVLQKNITKHLKESSKKNRKKRADDPSRPKRAPSGFAKPALISSDLCSFLEKPEGTEMARTEVTKNLTQYIKEHGLQDQNNRRKILPDEKLSKLLGVTASDEVTYFNLQKYMKVHFPKSSGSSA